MAEKRNVSKKTRFEVFKRDSFTCQYCGRPAPDVILELDHIKPISKGGENGILNLVTSCKECNRGKGNREISDDSALKRQQAQLADINERKLQMKMMLDWQGELNLLVEEQVDAVNALIADSFACYLSSSGRSDIKKLITRFGFVEVYESSKLAVAQYASADYAVSKIGGICFNRRRNKQGGE